MKNTIRSVIIPLTLIASLPVSACVPTFDIAYIEQDKTIERNRKKSADYRVQDDEVRLCRKLTLQNFIVKNRDLLPDMPSMHPGLSTNEAERVDYLDALRKRFPEISGEERENMLNTYISIAGKMRADQKCDLNLIPDEMEEFRLYLEGANEIYHRPGKTSPEAWKKLLALPPEKRFYRTTWVHFSLGSAFKQDIDLHFKNLREASKQGFRDTCGLGLRSFIVKYRSSKDPVERIRAAVAASTAEESTFADIRWGDKYSGFTLDKLDDKEFARLVSDPLCREICAIFSNSEKFRKAVLADGKKLRNADVCAYYSYRAFQIDEAQAFLKLLEQDTLLSCWVAAKVARYRDNIPGAVKHLRRYFDILSGLPAGEIKNQPLILKNGKPFSTEIYALIGTVKVLRRDFNEAAQLFFKAHSVDDLAIIIERYFTLAEAEKFISKTKCQTDEDQECLERIKYIAARRAFREGDYSTAIHYLPVEERQYVRDFVTYLGFSADSTASDDIRAFYLYRAAKILRYRGMELSGTHGWPDHFPGNFGWTTPCKKCVYERHTGIWQLCKECLTYGSSGEYRGFNGVENQLTVNRRFHYRYRAAELVFKAGDIAKSKQIKALCNMFGGKCLDKSPQEADIFFKRLVNDSRGTEISKRADEICWFPRDPDLEKELSAIDGCRDIHEAGRLMENVFKRDPLPEK